MMSIASLLAAMVTAFFVALSTVAPVSAAPTLTWTVDCTRGQSINHALERLPGRKLMLIIRGTCNESVLIDRDDATLKGDQAIGATVNGPSTDSAAIEIVGNRITLEGLTVTGGRDGITASGTSSVSILGSVIRNARKSGISIAGSQNASIEGCRIERNGSSGINLDRGASATIGNSVVTANAGAGMHLGGKSSAVAGGNTFSANGSNGIELFSGSHAAIYGNTITANGTNSAERGNGVFVSLTSADIGGNTITNNRQAGVLGDASILNVGGNTITGNADGIIANLASTLVENGDTISNNTGFGILFNSSSTGVVAGAKILFNSGDGLFLQFGSKLFLGYSTSTSGGNGGFGLRCADAESSVVGLELFSAYPPNGQGDVSPTCTGF
jgi:hypothetical protein